MYCLPPTAKAIGNPCTEVPRRAFPIAFAVGGKQYIAVPTGLGGGSPRNVPRAIEPDIKHPQNGNALYVFALPER